MSFCRSCGARIDNEQAQACPYCGASINAPAPASSVSNYNTYEPDDQYPMKWYKFLIYFLLFFGAFINLVNGVNYITGGIYSIQSNGQVSAELVYSLYDGLKTLDVILGLFMLAIAAFGIYTRFRLAGRKENGPVCLYTLYGVGAVLTVLYNIALLIVTGLNQLTDPTSIASFITSVVFICLNYIYFSKRKSSFVK